MSYSQSTNRSSLGVLANIANHQEKKYRGYIEENEQMGNGIAMRLARGEQFETLFGNEVTEEYRERLKVLAKENVQKERQLKAYISAINVVIGNAQETDQNEGSYEFKEQMETEYAKALVDIKQNSVLETQEETYLNLCKHLGEDQAEDDELAVVNPMSNDCMSKIRCPLTMTVMKDPVRSRVCKHSFSRDAIRQHLRNSTICPVPGCVNRSMKVSELEDDRDTEMLVRRYLKRESATKRAQAQSAIDTMSDEELEF